jgi:hypothetical protein
LAAAAAVTTTAVAVTDVASLGKDFKEDLDELDESSHHHHHHHHHEAAMLSNIQYLLACNPVLSPLFLQYLYYLYP